MLTSTASVKAQGFTLLELMIALVIAAIIVVLATPSFKQTVTSSLITTQANNLVSTISYARSEAVKRRTNVAVCASTDQATCSGANDWTTGWIVFVDTNTNGTFDGGEPIVRTQEAFKGNTTIDITPPPVVFNSQGLANSILSFNLSPYGCTTGETGSRTVSISATGRGHVDKSNCP